MDTFSAQDLWDRAHKDRRLNIVVRLGDFRYVPKCVTETARDHLAETDDVEKVLRYIKGAFNIYRASVSKLSGVPHYKVNGVHEWPALASSSWDDIDSIIAGGEHVEKGNVIDEFYRVIRNLSSRFEEVTVLREEGESTYIRKRALWERRIKYDIDDLSNVGFIPFERWNDLSLDTYANQVHQMLSDLLCGELLKTYARDRLELYLGDMVKTDALPIGRYKRQSDLVSMRRSISYG
jgi:hypothetical protein